MNTECGPISNCDDTCPLLKKCVKYRLEPHEVVKLATLINDWEVNKPAMDFFSSIGKMVLKLRGAAHG
jgi:hypothetical protein